MQSAGVGQIAAPRPSRVGCHKRLCRRAVAPRLEQRILIHAVAMVAEANEFATLLRGLKNNVDVRQVGGNRICDNVRGDRVLKLWPYLSGHR